jgi:hypothetical protein
MVQLRRQRVQRSHEIARCIVANNRFHTRTVRASLERLRDSRRGGSTRAMSYVAADVRGARRSARLALIT